MTQYTVEVKTGSINYGGTDARVFIQLIGAKGKSAEYRLDNPNHDDFERGQLDSFSISMEDVGWINQIRMHHDNHKRSAGWYLDYVRAINKDIGLSFKADFYRWLAKDEGDKKIDVTMPVPVNAVMLSKGSITSCYMGYAVKRRANESSVTTSFHDSFTYTFKQGTALKTSTAKVKNGGLKIDAKFFGVGCEFTGSAIKTITQQIDTFEEETVQVTSTFDITLQPDQQVTAICLYYQNILEGEVEGNDVIMGFENKFTIEPQIIQLDGWLSNGEVETYIMELLKRMITNTDARKSQLPHFQPQTSLPSKLPEANAQLVLAQRPFDVVLTKTILQSILSTVTSPNMKTAELMQGGLAQKLEVKNNMFDKLPFNN